MVAFICKENKMFFSKASLYCSSKKVINAFLLNMVASIISPSRSVNCSFKTVSTPFSEICTILIDVASFVVIDFSL